MKYNQQTTFFEKLKIIFAPDDSKGVSFFNRAILSMFDDWNRYRNADITKPEDKEPLEILNKAAKNLGVSAPHLVIYSGRFPFAGKANFSDTIIITQGAIDALNSKELEAVLSHELVHKKYGIRDTLINATLAIGTIVSSSMFFNRKKTAVELPNKSSFAKEMKIYSTALAGFLPLDMAFYRAREFEADRDGSIASGKPMELAEGLQKLRDGQKSLYEKYKINNNNTFVDTLSEIPPRSAKNFIKEIIANEPPTEDRVARLKAMDAANKAAEAQVSH